MAFATGEAVWGSQADNAARKYGVDPQLFRRLIKQESGWNPNAGSPAGALGLTQVVPKWHPNANLSTPQGQLDYGAKHLGSLLKKYGNPRDALAVYNSGKPWSVSQSYGETRNYVTNILNGYGGRGTVAAGGPGVRAPSAPSGVGAPRTNPTSGPVQLDTDLTRDLGQFTSDTEAAVMRGDWMAVGAMDPTSLANRLGAAVSRSSQPSVTAQPAGAHYPGDGHDHGPMEAVPNGPLKRNALVPHGDWGGAAGPVRELTKLAKGLVVSSEKRTRRNTASGGVSDHWTGSTQSFARDLAWGGSMPTPTSDIAASRIVEALGGPKNWGKTGGNFVKVVNGIRYQVLYRTNIGGNHWDHVHIGARRVR